MTQISSEKIDLSVIIVLYKSRGVIAKCLDSIEEYNDLGNGLEVILVDNSPADDETYAFVEKNYPWAKLVRNAGNTGFGAGNNAGAALARGRYLLFLNPDTYLIEPVFAYAVERFDADRRLHTFGMTLVDSEGRPAKSFGIMLERRGLLPTSLYRYLIKYLGWTPSSVFPWGADLFVRKELFERAGGFDEKIFLCNEEPDLVRRLGRGRVRIFGRRIVHDEGHTTGCVTRRTQAALESEAYYFNKYGLSYRRYASRAKRKVYLQMAFRYLLGTKPVVNEEMRILIEHYGRVASGQAGGSVARVEDKSC